MTIQGLMTGREAMLRFLQDEKERLEEFAATWQAELDNEQEDGLQDIWDMVNELQEQIASADIIGE